MKRLKTILSAFLALLVLISTTSFTIDKHICMGRVHSVSILTDAAPCAMEMMAPDGVNPMKGCCKDEQTKIVGNDLQVKIVKPITLAFQSLWTATLAHVIITFDLQSAVVHYAHHSYKPPLIEREISLLVQSFLI